MWNGIPNEDTVVSLGKLLNSIQGDKDTVQRPCSKSQNRQTVEQLLTKHNIY